MLAWPETAVLTMFCIEAVVLFSLAITAPAAFTTAWLINGFAITFRVGLFTCLPIWLVLRLLDWLTAGPARRKRNGVISFLP
jgi:hypothetical protein